MSEDKEYPYKKLIEIYDDGRIFWRDREVETDEDFKSAMIELKDYWAGKVKLAQDQLAVALDALKSEHSYTRWAAIKKIEGMKR